MEHNSFFSAEAMRSIAQQYDGQAEKIQTAISDLIEKVNKKSVEAAEVGLYSTRLDITPIMDTYDLNIPSLEKVTEKIKEYLDVQHFNYYVEYDENAPDDCVICWNWKE